MRKSVIIVVLLTALVGSVGNALATASFYPRQLSSTEWVIKVQNLVDAGGIDLTINYDRSAYSSAAARWDSFANGGLGIVNAKIPGQIRMAVMSTQPFGSTAEATVAYVTLVPVKPNYTPMPTLGVNVVNANANALAAVNHEPDETSNPGSAKTDISGSGASVTNSGSTTTVATISPAGVSGPSYLGNVTFDSSPLGSSDDKQKEQVAAREKQRESVEPPPSVAAVPTQVAKAETTKEAVPEAKAPEKPGSEKFIAMKGALQRFKEFQDEYSPAKLIALFAEPAPVGFRQEPPIVVADGTRTVTVTIAGTPEQQTPNFVLKGAHLLSLKKNAEGWVVEAQPEKGAYDVALAMIEKTTITEYPLSVIPPSDPKLKAMTAADFALFLKERKNEKFPLYDLNGDGKRDNLDAYIFTANYLLSQKPGTKGELISAENGKKDEVVAPEKEKKTTASDAPKGNDAVAADKPTVSEEPVKKKGKKSKAANTGNR